MMFLFWQIRHRVCIVVHFHNHCNTQLVLQMAATWVGDIRHDKWISLAPKGYVLSISASNEEFVLILLLSPRLVAALFTAERNFWWEKQKIVVLVFSFVFACTAASMSESCAVEGSIRTQSRHNVTSYHLLQVCLFGQWNYVCSFGFNNIALNVVLHQLGYTGGGVCIIVCFINIVIFYHQSKSQLLVLILWVAINQE